MAVMATPADIDLWHDYARQLKLFFPFSDEDHGPQRIYSVPLTSVGISIGRDIKQSIVNHDLFRIGDLLLPPDSPVFLPGPSYSERLLRYLQAVEIPPGKQDAQTRAALDAAIAHLSAETDAFLTLRHKALELYSVDPERSSLSFDEWTKLFYPPYDQAQQQKNAASQIASDTSMDYYGAQTDDLWADKARVSKAFSETANPPYNMPTSTAQLTAAQVLGPGQPLTTGVTSDGTVAGLDAGDIKFEPRYTIDAAFNFIAMSWVKNAFNKKNKPVVINFHSTSSSNGASAAGDWSDVGFEDQQSLFTRNSKILPVMPLFTSNLSSTGRKGSASNQLVIGIGNRQTTTVSIKISASDAQVFAVSPDEAWNLADAAEQYPVLRPDASKDLYDPFVLVTHVLLGYMVSVTIQVDSATFSDIDGGLRDAKAAAGRATLFGLDIGPVSNNGMVGFEQVQTDASTQTFTIPPRDSATLTLLGIMGEKLATPRRRA